MAVLGTPPLIVTILMVSVKDEVAVLGTPPVIVTILMVSVDVKPLNIQDLNCGRQSSGAV